MIKTRFRSWSCPLTSGTSLLPLLLLATIAAAQDQGNPTAAATAPSAKSATVASEKHLERQRAFAKMRMRQDERRFSRSDVAKAEELYEAANGNWQGEAARESLKTMLQRYPELNRTGCAVLNVAQASTGDERERLLRLAVEKHGDCFYRTGVQVGGMARYLLAHAYRSGGKSGEAEKLLEEIRKNYPEAVTHDGRLLAAVLREEGTSGKQSVPATQPGE